MTLFRRLCVSIFVVVATGFVLLPAHAQELVYVTDAPGHTVWIIDTASRAIVGSIDVAVWPTALVATPDGTRLYVRHEPTPSGAPDLPTVSVIDTATNTVVASVPVGEDQYGEMAITPDGGKVYVANARDSSVTVFDTLTNAVITTIFGVPGAQGMAASPDGSQIYVADFGLPRVQIINTASDTLDAATIDTLGSIGGETIAFRPDGARAYVANWISSTLSVIDTAAKTTIATIGLPVTASGVTVTPDGSSAWIASYHGFQVTVIDTATNAITAAVPFGTRPNRIAFTADGSTAYVNTDGGLVVIDTATLGVITTLLAGKPIAGIVAVTLAAPSAEEQIADVTADVADLVAAGSLNGGQGNALTKKLAGALAQLAKGKVVVAMNRLGAFINQTQSLIDDGVLTAAEGQPLIDAANAAIAAILEAG